MSETRYEATGDLLDLLSRLEENEEIVLTSEGRAVGKVVRTMPPTEEVMGRIRRRRQEIADQLRSTGQSPITTDEIIGWIREGRR